MDRHCANNKTIFNPWPYQVNFWDQNLQIPTVDLSTTCNDSRQRAALKVQALWRGVRVRKQFQSLKVNLREQKAARVIQRCYRNRLYLKSVQAQPLQQYLERISEDRLEHLKSSINKWQKKHKFTYQGHEKLEEQHREVQKGLHSFYLRSITSQNRDRQTVEKCAQIEATAILLNGSPSLRESAAISAEMNKELSFFYCLSLADASEARLRHKKQMKVLDNRWWQAL